MPITLDGIRNKLSRLLRDLSFRNDGTQPGSAQIVTLRNCRLQDNTFLKFGSPLVYTERYEDTMIVFGKNKDGQTYTHTAKAASKPGLSWLRAKAYMASDILCPTLQPGQYQFVRGLHKNHPAMRQQKNNPFCVVRDLNEDDNLDDPDRVEYLNTTGITIQAGPGGQNMGYNSLGCQLVFGGWKDKPWKAIHNDVWICAKDQVVFHYTILDFAMFVEWHDRCPTKWLMFGSEGPSVTMLQNILVLDGYLGQKSADGVWGRTTDNAVRTWQKSQGLRPSGIVRL